jgi:hypothetical protein
LFISQLVIGRVSQQATIQVSKRVETNDGRFLGVLVFSLAPGNLTTLHNSVNLGERGVIALEGLDGITRASFSRSSPDTHQGVSSIAPLWSDSSTDRSLVANSALLNGVDLQELSG